MTEIQDTSQPFHHDDTCDSPAHSFNPVSSPYTIVVFRNTPDNYVYVNHGTEKMAESMVEEVLEQKEGNPGSDPKFQRFAATVERALKGFELSREWQDLISCLTRLNKV